MRKIIKTLLVVMVVALTLAAFTACDMFTTEPEAPKACEHKGGAATCEAAAVCELCGESYGEALGHDMSAATCTEAAACKREGCEYTEGKALGHKNGFTTPVQPTCTEEGISAKQYCTVCNEVFIEAIVIPAKGHTEVVVLGKDATCEETGLTEGKKCDVCGETLVAQEEIPAKGHTLVDVEGKDATCTEDGYTAHKACECGYTEGKEVIAATGHKLVDVEGKDATCTEDGYTAHKACECGYTEGKEVVDATGHKYDHGICSCGDKDPAYVDYYLVGYINGADHGCEGDWENLGDYKFVDGKLTATFTADSYIFVKSGNLNGESVKWYLFETYTTGKEGTLIENKSEKMFIPGNVEVVFTLTVNEDGTLTLVADYHTHTWSEVEGKDATCTADGYTAHKACDCGETQGKEVITKLDHSDESGDYKCDVCSTKVLPADGTVLTIEQAIALGKLFDNGTYSTQKYYITGVIANTPDSTWGNCYIKDENGTELLIYGLYDSTGKTRYDALSYKPVKGDEITVYTVIGAYGNNPQGKNGWLDEVVAHDHVWVDATCKAPKTCSLCEKTEGDVIDHVFVDGVCSGCGKEEGSAALSNAKLDFSNKSNRTTFTTSQQVWEQNGVKLINDKSSSTSPVADYANPARFYKSSKITIEGVGMTKIVFNCNSSSYATALKSSIATNANYTVTVSGSAVTVTFNSAVDSFVITSLTGGQVRINNIVVNP